jgi:hypothetical protein
MDVMIKYYISFGVNNWGSLLKEEYEDTWMTCLYFSDYSGYTFKEGRLRLTLRTNYEQEGDD